MISEWTGLLGHTVMSPADILVGYANPVTPMVTIVDGDSKHVGHV